MPKKKVSFDPHNKRLDQFLTALQIELETKQKIIQYVEELTFETILRRSKPNLRLRKL